MQGRFKVDLRIAISMGRVVVLPFPPQSTVAPGVQYLLSGSFDTLPFIVLTFLHEKWESVELISMINVSF